MNKYQEIRDQIKEGDVIAFGGESILSSVIKFRTRSPYSHVAMIRGRYSGRPGESDMIMMIESTMSVDTPDLVHGEIIKGVQLHYLDEVIRTAEAKIWWVPLKKVLTMDQDQRMIAWLHKKHQSRTPYDKRQAVGCAIDWIDALGYSNTPDFEKLFCSEMVARAYQKASLIDDSVNASEMTPQDVVDLSCLQEPVLIKSQ